MDVVSVDRRGFEPLTSRALSSPRISGCKAGVTTAELPAQYSALFSFTLLKRIVWSKVGCWRAILFIISNIQIARRSNARQPERITKP